MRHACPGVRKSSVLPAKHDSDIGGEVLLSTVDVGDVHHPDSDGDLSRSGLDRRPLDRSGHFRTAPDLDRHRKEDKPRKADSLHEITGKRPDSILEFVQLPEWLAHYIGRRDLN